MKVCDAKRESNVYDKTMIDQLPNIFLAAFLMPFLTVNPLAMGLKSGRIIGLWWLSDMNIAKEPFE